ncbi:MAG: hypothetical protein ACK4GR_06215 [bacterium]
MSMEIVLLTSILGGSIIIGVIIFLSLNAFLSSLNNKIDKLLSTTEELNHTLRKIQELMENSKPIIYNFQEVSSNIKKITNNVSEITSDINFITRKGRNAIEAAEKVGLQSLQKIGDYIRKAINSRK